MLEVDRDRMAERVGDAVAESPLRVTVTVRRWLSVFALLVSVTESLPTKLTEFALNVAVAGIDRLVDLVWISRVRLDDTLIDSDAVTSDDDVRVRDLVATLDLDFRRSRVADSVRSAVRDTEFPSECVREGIRVKDLDFVSASDCDVESDVLIWSTVEFVKFSGFVVLRDFVNTCVTESDSVTIKVPVRVCDRPRLIVLLAESEMEWLAACEDEGLCDHDKVGDDSCCDAESVSDFVMVDPNVCVCDISSAEVETNIEWEIDGMWLRLRVPLVSPLNVAVGVRILRFDTDAVISREDELERDATSVGDAAKVLVGLGALDLDLDLDR